MIAQDTGSAIVGPARADLYCGAGDEAGRIAGRIRHHGRFVDAAAARARHGRGRAPDAAAAAATARCCGEPQRHQAGHEERRYQDGSDRGCGSTSVISRGRSASPSGPHDGGRQAPATPAQRHRARALAGRYALGRAAKASQAAGRGLGRAFRGGRRCEYKAKHSVKASLPKQPWPNAHMCCRRAPRHAAAASPPLVPLDRRLKQRLARGPRRSRRASICTAAPRRRPMRPCCASCSGRRAMASASDW